MTKPPYKVPSMEEIKAIPWNGHNVISTFSGAGGSCLGYRMAGYRVLWASEFIPAAQEVYKLNHPNSILDTRDIREVQPAEILEAIGLDVGEVDIMDGSPPCASFSTAGKREAGWGKVKKYSDTKQRVDDLFFEYARLVEGLKPKVFIAENVSGMVKGTAKGYFKMILQALKDCGYTVSARVLDAQWLGVPQMRQRLIFCGVRDDLAERYGVKPAHPDPLPYQYTTKDALPEVFSVESANGFNNHEFYTSNKPMGAIQQSRPLKVEAETSLEGYKIGQMWEQIGPGRHHPERFSLYKLHPSKPCATIQQRMANKNGKPFMGASCTHPYEKRYLSIAELKRIMAFPDDFELTGTYARQWERLGRAVPPRHDVAHRQGGSAGDFGQMQIKDETTPNGKWEFDEGVTAVFDDMLRRSIPQYETMRGLCLHIGSKYVVDGRYITDLGSSRGEAIDPFIATFKARNYYQLVEISPPMLTVLRERYAALSDAGVVDVYDIDLRTDFPPFPSCLTLSVLTLQFTPIEHRLKILNNIYKHLHPGGAFILVEKVIGATADIDAHMVDVYYDLKRANGYTEDQIQRKRLSLEGSLVPVTAKFNEDMLRGAGFSEVDCFWRWANFTAWVAVKK